MHRVQCSLSAVHISEEFKRALGTVMLDEIFVLGQAIAFRVIKAAQTRGKCCCFFIHTNLLSYSDVNPSITIDPAAVNSYLVPAFCKNALVVNGSVVSVENKGECSLLDYCFNL